MIRDYITKKQFSKTFEEACLDCESHVT